MSFLVLNIGSSSVKYTLFGPKEKTLLHDRIEGGASGEGIAKQILRRIGSTEGVEGIAHRIVHSGDSHGTVDCITPSLVKHLRDSSAITPLHSNRIIDAVNAFLEFVPVIPEYAVFDSGFFASLPEVARAYALPAALRERYSLRRNGFHGISHEYACREAAKKLKIPFEKLTLLSLHLGSGSSMALVHREMPLDTSMGFTPLEGLSMVTRAGDIDPGIILYVLKKFIEEKGGNDKDAVERLEHLLNKESGLAALAGTADFKKILDEAKESQNARFALDFFVYRIRKYVGSYLAITPRIPDAIVLTGAIGAGDARFRKMLFRNFPLVKDLPVIVIPPNEELAMMRMVTKMINDK